MKEILDKTKEIIFSSTYYGVDKQDFKKNDTFVTLHRIMLLSLSITVMSIFFFYSDFVLFKNLKNTVFWNLLISLHIFCFSVSVIILLTYKKIKKAVGISRFPDILIKAYIFTCLFLGVVASYNSQAISWNMNLYVVVILLLTFAFPVEPHYMSGILIINQILFIIMIIFLDQDIYTKLANQINSSVVVFVAIFMSFALYKFRLNEYITTKNLKTSEENLKKLFLVSPLPLMVFRYDDYKLLFSNNRALHFYDFSEKDIQTIYANDIIFSKQEWAGIIDHLNSCGNLYDHVIEQNTITGQKKWVITNYEIIVYSGEKAILCQITDVSELKRMERELTIRASTDFLTGVRNRRVGIKKLEEAIISTEKGMGGFVLCFADIDGLKSINDIYGHSEGDFLIRTICIAIIEEINKEDIIFRYGGDEFIVIFKNKEVSAVKEICNGIKVRLKQINIEYDKPYTFGLSIGLYEYTKGCNLTAEEIIQSADREMYKEKG